MRPSPTGLRAASPKTTAPTAATTRSPLPVGRRLLVLRNVLKVWAILLVLAAAFGAAGWQLGGYRVALLFLGSIVLLGAAIYAYADRIVMGMLGAREMVEGEAP